MCVRVRLVAVMVAVALLWNQSFDNRRQLGPENPAVPTLAVPPDELRSLQGENALLCVSSTLSSLLLF